MSTESIIEKVDRLGRAVAANPADEVGWAELLRILFPIWRRSAAAHAGPELAEEVVQGAAVRLWRYVTTAPPKASLVRNWFAFAIQIGRFATASALRAPDTTVNAEEDFENFADPRASWSSAGEDADLRLMVELLPLDETDREIVFRMASAGETYAEISAAIRLPVGTVGSRVFRLRHALRKLRKTLRDD